jgi:hypothetical protein
MRSLQLSISQQTGLHTFDVLGRIILLLAGGCSLALGIFAFVVSQGWPHPLSGQMP